jgi:methionine sulfoxide reductase heme-binding subunit
MIHLDLIASGSLQVAGQRVGTSWPWYVIRAAGFISAGLIVLLMLSGIGQVTGFTYRFLEPVKAWALHKAMALALVVSIAVHIGFLLIDHFVKFSLLQLFVPFLSRYNNHTQLLGLPLGWAAVGLGVLAMYGVVIIVLSSLGWIDTKKRAWRKLHYLSYVVALFVFLHALYAGSDVQYGIFRAAWMFLGLIVVIGMVMRLWRAGSTKQRVETKP